MHPRIAFIGVALLVGHGGQPLDSGSMAQRAPEGGGSASAGASAGAAIDASRFLAAARGSAPVICSLAGAPVGNGWGYSGAPLDQDAGDAGLVEWAFKPSMTAEDLTVMEAGLRDGDPCVRSMAARLLGSMRGDGVRILNGALADDRAATRRAAAEGLGYAETSTSSAALIRLLGDRDAGVRATAAWALGRIEAHDAVDALGDALADRALTVRLAAIRALGELELERSIDLILPMLLAQEPVMRVAAARALGELH